MTAEEARKLSRIGKESEFETAIEVVEDMIIEATKKGEYETGGIRFDSKDFGERVATHFRKLGFRVFNYYGTIKLNWAVEFYGEGNRYD